MPQAAPSQGHSENRWPTCGGSSSPWASALQWHLFGSHFPRRPPETLNRDLMTGQLTPKCMQVRGSKG